MRTVVTTPTIVRHGPYCDWAAPSPGSEPAPERAFRPEMLLREGGIHDRDRQLRVEIVVPEVAALDELLTQHVEEPADTCSKFVFGRSRRSL